MLIGRWSADVACKTATTTTTTTVAAVQRTAEIVPVASRSGQVDVQQRLVDATCGRARGIQRFVQMVVSRLYRPEPALEGGGWVPVDHVPSRLAAASLSSPPIL